MKKFALFLLFEATAISVQAQDTLFGTVSNGATGDKMPYATVVVVGHEIGTLADKDGVYRLVTTSDVLPVDAVQFSHVGFETTTRMVAELLNCEVNVTLQPVAYQIEGIVVTNRKSRNVKLGHSSGGARMFSSPFFTGGEVRKGDRVGKELGTTIRVRHDSQLLSFNMLISMNRYLTARFRLSFYAMNGDVPGDVIVHKDIMFEVADRARGRFEVDLTPYDIWLDGGQEVLATLTLLDDDGVEAPNLFFLNSNMLSGKGIFRRSVGDREWERAKNGVVTIYFDAIAYPRDE